LLSLVVCNWTLWRSFSMYCSIMKWVLSLVLNWKLRTKLRSRIECWVDLNPNRSNQVRVSLHRSAAALIGGAPLFVGSEYLSHRTIKAEVAHEPMFIGVYTQNPKRGLIPPSYGQWQESPLPWCRQHHPHSRGTARVHSHHRIQGYGVHLIII
jgi:hypothetical protein